MTTLIDLNFKKNYTTANGKEVAGAICVRNRGGNRYYLASTLTTSKFYKNIKCAEKYMTARGYKEI